MNVYAGNHSVKGYHYTFDTISEMQNLKQVSDGHLKLFINGLLKEKINIKKENDKNVDNQIMTYPSFKKMINVFNLLSKVNDEKLHDYLNFKSMMNIYRKVDFYLSNISNTFFTNDLFEIVMNIEIDTVNVWDYENVLFSKVNKIYANNEVREFTEKLLKEMYSINSYKPISNLLKSSFKKALIKNKSHFIYTFISVFQNEKLKINDLRYNSIFALLEELDDMDKSLFSINTYNEKTLVYALTHDFAEMFEKFIKEFVINSDTITKLTIEEVIYLNDSYDFVLKLYPKMLHLKIEQRISVLKIFNKLDYQEIELFIAENPHILRNNPVNNI